MEAFLVLVGVTFGGGALFRWLRHGTWRISAFIIIFLALARMAFRASPSRDTEIALIVMAALVVLPLIGAYLIGILLRSRVAQAAKGGAILLSKNVDALAEVAKQQGDTLHRK